MEPNPNTAKDEEPDVTMTDARDSETDLDPDDDSNVALDDK